MTASAARATNDINLDEFERRLRAAGSVHGAAEDPLAELARLVDAVKRGTVALGAKDEPTVAPNVSQAPPVLPPAPTLEPPETASAPAALSVAPPAFEDEPLRGGFDETAEPAEAFEHDGEPEASEPGDFAIADEVERPRRSIGRRIAVGVLALAGIAMLGGAFAMKFGYVGLPKAPPFIAASTAPTKVQPPTDEAVSTPTDANVLFQKDAATKAAPVKVVDTQEQPLDLKVQTAEASPVAASQDAPIIAPAEPQAAVAPLFPEPKPVRTVSLRPDGTPIQSPALPTEAAAPGAPAAAVALPSTTRSIGADNPQPADAQPETPKLDVAPKPVVKSSARVAIPKTDTTVPASAATDTPNAPLQLGPKADKLAKKDKAAAAAPPLAASAPAPAPVVAAAEPASPAAAAGAPAATTGAGDWAVQLAAPRSEGEAQSTIARLKTKYGALLGDSELGVHKAVVNGDTVYRVRVSGLSKSDAAALCSKVKASGGDCFLAK